MKIENGFTKIDNKILEMLAKTDLNGTQRRVLDVLFRYTAGFHRHDHELSLTFISKATNIHRMQIQRELAALIERNIVIVVSDASFNKTRALAINENVDEWDSKLIGEQLAKKLPVSGLANTPVSGLANTPQDDKNQVKATDNNGGDGFEHIPQGVSGLANQERNTLKKDKERALDTFFNDLWKLYPRKKGKGKVSQSKKNKLYDIGLEHLTRAIERYKQETRDTEVNFIMHGSTFFNTGYVDYLDENYTVDKKIENEIDDVCNINRQY